MKRMIAYIILVCSFFSGFLAKAQVVCASPQTGDSHVDAGTANSVCNPNAQNNGDRDVNVSQIVMNVTAGEAKPADSSSSNRTGDNSGSLQ